MKKCAEPMALVVVPARRRPGRRPHHDGGRAGTGLTEVEVQFGIDAEAGEVHPRRGAADRRRPAAAASGAAPRARRAGRGLGARATTVASCTVMMPVLTNAVVIALR